MVAALLSLRWRIVRHQYRRDWWRVLSLIAGLLWSFSAVPALLFGAQALSFESSEVRNDALVGLGAVLGFGWVAVPLLVSGVDDALDPTRFASWGVPAGRLVPGLAVAAFTTVPALFFVAIAAIMASVWRREDAAVPLMAFAFAGALLSVASWVIGARLAALWGARALTARWGRAVLTSIGVATVGALVSVVVVVRADGLDSFIEYEAATAFRQAALTPIGAGLAAPSNLALGDVTGAWWRLGLMAAWVGLLMVAWRAAVAHALVNPLTKPAGGVRTADGILAAATSPDTRRRAVQAVFARASRAWRTDPRYLAQMVGALATPVIFTGIAAAALGKGDWLLLVPVGVAVSIGWARHNDLAFESTALWLDITAGVPGGDVARGRLLAVLGWAGPMVVAASVLAVGASGRWAALPAVIATALGTLGISLGVAAVMAVLFPYRVPAPGENPFGTQVGTLGASLAGQAVSSVGTGAIVPLVAAPLVAAMVWSGVWWVAAIVVGLAALPLGLIAGERLAGKAYDAKAGRLIAAVS